MPNTGGKATQRRPNDGSIELISFSSFSVTQIIEGLVIVQP